MTQDTPIHTSICSHCKNPLTHTLIQKDNLFFCCEGCSKVYSMLHGEGMEFYYQLLEMENTSAPQALYKESYKQYLARLEDPEELKTMGTWKGNIHSVDLESADLHCAACGWLLEKVIPKIPGVQFFGVDFVRGHLQIDYNTEKTQLSSILQILAQMGYAFKIESKDALHLSIPRSLLLRLGVAGGVFANEMLFSIGLYFGTFQGMNAEHIHYFNWASFILDIPVVLWCAQPFYQKAISGLKAKTAHIDLPISLGILIAFSVSCWQLYLGKHGFFDGISGLVFFLLIGRWISHKFEQNLTPDPRWFARILPQKVLRVEQNENKNEWVELQSLKTHDLIWLAPGDYLPTDGILVTEKALFDTQMMTGESQARELKKGALLSAGFLNLKQSICLEVSAPANESKLHLLQEEWNKMSLEKSAQSVGEKIVPYFTPTVLSIALISLYFNWHLGLNEALYRAAVVLIISCPCALALSRPFSLGVAFKRAKESGFLLRSERALEKLSECDTILLDKTGTLTFHQQKLEKWVWQEDILNQNELAQKWRSRLRQICAQSVHPVALTLLDELEENQEIEKNDPLENLQETAGVGLSGTFEHGKSLVELISLRAAQEKYGITYNLSPPPRNVFLHNQQVVAWIWLRESIRPEMRAMIDNFKAQEKNIVLLSGDTAERVASFALEVGIKKAYGNLSPEEKLQALLNLKAEGKKTFAVGDGINDALMLSEAHSSLLVHGGAQSLSSGVDALFVGQSLAKLPHLFKLASQSQSSIVRCYLLSIAYNIAALSVAFSGVLPPLAAAISMPLSSLSVGLMAWVSVKKFGK